MKSMKCTLAAAALALAFSSVAGADEHRGRSYRDGARHTQAAPRHPDSLHRVPRRGDKRHAHGRHDRHAHYRYGRAHGRHDWRHREHWRAHKRAEKRARHYWRLHRGLGHRAVYPYWQANTVRYLDHGYRDYSYTVWLDDVGFVVKERQYR